MGTRQKKDEVRAGKCLKLGCKEQSLAEAEAAGPLWERDALAEEERLHPAAPLLEPRDRGEVVGPTGRVAVFIHAQRDALLRDAQVRNTYTDLKRIHA